MEIASGTPPEHEDNCYLHRYTFQTQHYNATIVALTLDAVGTPSLAMEMQFNRPERFSFRPDFACQFALFVLKETWTRNSGPTIGGEQSPPLFSLAAEKAL